MITNSSVCITIIILFCNIQRVFSNNSSINTTYTGEIYATINPDYQRIIADLFLPDDYILPKNVYLWNVSEIIYYINQSDSQILYIIDTTYLVEIFPEYFLRQLPRNIIVAHGLYYLLPSNDTSFSNSSNVTHIVSTCMYPFVETKYDTYFQWDFEDLNSSFSCGLLCDYGDVLWGIKPEDQYVTDIFLYVCSILFLLMVMLTGMNQCMDLQLSKEEHCCHRGFLFHAPMCLICFYAFVALCFLVPLLIGKSNVVCAKDIDDNLTVSMRNPGGSMLCTIVGSLFYAATLLFGLYTMGFTFVLWKQFFSPLQSLWSKLKTYKICCPCAACLDFILPVVTSCLYCIQTTPRMKKMSSHSPRATSGGRSRKKRRKVTCGDIFCSSTSCVHYILWSIAIVYTLMAIFEQSIDAFSPLGICTVGGQEEAGMLKYNVVPFTIVFLCAVFFLPFAIFLLWKVTKSSTNFNKEHKKMMRSLGRRILWYFICQLLCWIFVCEVSWVFHDKRSLILDAAEERMFCLTYRAKVGDIDRCYKGYSLWSGLYIQMALTLPLAGAGSILLSCHSKNQKRWKIIYNAINDCIHCKKYQHKSHIVDRLHGDASELQSSRDTTNSKYGKTIKDASSTIATTTKSNQKQDDKVPITTKLQSANSLDVVPNMSPLGAPSTSTPDISTDEVQMADL